jgi:N-acetylneuraminic acid mutarotase
MSSVLLFPGLDPAGCPAYQTRLRRTAALVGAATLVLSAVAAHPSDPWSRPAPVTATVVAPGILSTPDAELGLVLSSDGLTAYVTRLTADRDQPGIFEYRWTEGSWSQPRLVFADPALAVSPSLSPDGARMAFVRSEPNSYKFQLVVSRREGESWTAPQPIAGISAATAVFDPAWAPDGSLYFATTRPELWDLELQRAKPQGETYAAPESLGPRINSRYDDTAATVSPDGKLLVFASTNRPEGLGGSDLYVCVQRDGQWSPARHLGPLVNTAAEEGHPRFSPDQQRLFFSRDGDVYEIATSVLLEPSPESRRTWQARASLPQGRVWARCVALGGRIYVIGGNSGWGQGTGPLRSMVEYDPKNDAWRERAAPPQGDVLAPAAVVGDRIVLFQRTADAMGFEYDPATDRWSKRAGATPAFSASPHNSAVACSGHIFAARSVWAASQALGDFFEYDPVQSRWRGLGATPMAPPGVILSDDTLVYLVGGGTEMDRVAAFNPKTGTWTFLPSLNAGRVEVRCAIWRGRLVAVGGHTNRDGNAVDTVEMFDPNTRRWQRLANLPDLRWGAGVAVCDDRLFVIGGSPDAIASSPAASTVWEYLPES